MRGSHAALRLVWQMLRGQVLVRLALIGEVLVSKGYGRRIELWVYQLELRAALTGASMLWLLRLLSKVLLKYHISMIYLFI